MSKHFYYIATRLAACCAIAAVLSACSRESKKNSYLQKADKYFSAGEYEKAEIEYKNVLQQGGLDPQAIGRLGIIYFEQGRLGRASGFLRKSSELQPDNLAVRLKNGYFHLASGKFHDARDAALFILDRNPQDPDAPILLAESAMQAQDAMEARTRLQKLPAPAAGSAPVLTALGLLDLRERKYKEAESFFERARELAPKLAITSASLGRLYWAQNDLARAEKFFATAAELSPPRSPLRLQQVQFNLQTGHADVAKRLLEETMRQTPDFLPSYILLSNMAFIDKKYDESITLLDKALARDPDHPEALLLASQVRMAKGDNEKALSILERTATLYPQSPQVHHQLGVAYLVNGDTGNATNSFTQAIKLAPGFAAPTLALARINLRQGNFGPAIASLKTLVQQNPTLGEARLLLAEAHKAQGNLDEALAIYQQLAEAAPRSAQVQYLAGSVLLQQNKNAEARQTFGKALELSPEFIPALEQLVNLDLAEKQFGAAQARLEAHIAKSPRDAGLYLILAKVHLAQRNIEKAETALQKTIELQPDIAAAYFLLAQLYISTNQHQKALANLQAASAKNPKDHGSIMLIGVLQENQKDYAAARDSYEKVLSLNPKAGAALNNLAYLYSEHFGELDKAQELAQRARDLLPNQGESADTLGWILYKKRQYPRALTLLTESADKLPDNAEARFHLGMVHYMMGNEELARAALERAVQSGKAFDGLDEAKQSLSVLSIDAGKPSESTRALLQQAITRRKDDPVAMIRLAKLHERDGNTKKAIEAYETALKTNPANVNAALGLIRLYQAQTEPAKAFELGKATRKLAPTDATLAHAVGRLAYDSGDYTWSVSLLQEASRKLTGDPEVLFDLAQATYSIGQVAAAENTMKEALQASAIFSRAGKSREFLEMLSVIQTPLGSGTASNRVSAILKSDPTNLPALMAKGALDEKSGDAKSAKQVYETALTRYPDFSPAKRQLAILYSTSPDEGQRALELATKAREAFPSDPNVAKALGMIVARQGNHSRAATLLQESARVLVADAEVMYYLGMSQRQLKDQSAAATRSLQRALELGLPEKLAAEARRALANK